MRNVFGVCSYSLDFFYEKIVKWTELKKLKIKVFKISDIVEEGLDYDIILFPSITVFQRHLDFIKSKATVVVFDNPVLLSEYSCMELLDAMNGAESFRFTLKPVDFRLFKEKTLSKKSVIKTITKEEMEIIPKVIATFQKGDILDKYNTFIYTLTNVSTRNKVSKILLEFLFDNLDIKAFETRLKKTMTLDNILSKQYYEEFVNVMRSEVGLNLKNACMKAYKYKLTSKPVNYKSICKEFKINKFEIKYLMALRRRLENVKIKDTDIKTLVK